MADAPKLVRDVAAALKEEPLLRVPDLADRFDVGEREIVEILDEWEIDSTGKPRHVGPGGGGGWTTPAPA